MSEYENYTTAGNLLETLKTAKEKNKATYEELARAAGCTPDTVKNLFSGKNSCANFFQICAIFKALGLSIDEYVGIPKQISAQQTDSTALLKAMEMAQTAYREQIEMMRETRDEYRDAIAKARERHDRREKRQTIFIVILLIIVFLLIGAFIALWTYDILNPTIGWIRKQIVEMANGVHSFFHGDGVEISDWIREI